MDRIINLFKTEPLVVINAVAALVYGVVQTANEALDAGDGWLAVVWAVAMFVARSQVWPNSKVVS